MLKIFVSVRIHCRRFELSLSEIKMFPLCSAKRAAYSQSQKGSNTRKVLSLKPLFQIQNAGLLVDAVFVRVCLLLAFAFVLAGSAKTTFIALFRRKF